MYTNTRAAAGEAPPNRRQYVYFVTLILSLLAFGTGAYVAKCGIGRDYEYAVLSAVNGLPATWHLGVLTITLMGSNWMVLLTVAVAYFAKLYQLTWRLALSTITAYCLGFLAKAMIAHPRPEHLFEGIHVYVHESGMGYPSLHVTIATVVMLTCVSYLPRKWWWLVPLVIGVVGLSRMYLGVHSPLDIVGGVALGSAVVAVFRLLPERVRTALRLSGGSPR